MTPTNHVLYAHATPTELERHASNVRTCALFLFCWRMLAAPHKTMC